MPSPGDFAGGWSILRCSGDIDEFLHRQPSGGGREAWVYTPSAAALVVGSSQALDQIDEAACSRRGISIHRRRSGGGAVLVVPDEMLWVDFVIPRDDVLWSGDVGRAMHWVGAVWIEALAGRAGDLRIHRGRLETDPLATSVCFAGRGPGEILVAESGSKVVGISQRRTARWARFQTMCHLRWRPEVMSDVLSGSPPVDHLAGIVRAVEVGAPELLGALSEALSGR